MEEGQNYGLHTLQGAALNTKKVGMSIDKSAGLPACLVDVAVLV